MTKPRPSVDRSRDKPDVFMPVFIDKFLGDTMHCTTLERGAYMLLLFHHWKAQGPIDGSDATLMTVAAVTPQQWRAMRTKILAFFSPGPDPGTLVQKRAMAEMDVARSQKTAASGRGAAGAEGRWGPKSDATASSKHPETGSKGGANGMLGDATRPLPPPEPQNSLNTNSGSAREEFGRFVEKYPIRKGDPIPATEVFWLDLAAAGKSPPIGPLLDAVDAYRAHLVKNPSEPVLFMRRFIGERWPAWLPVETQKTAIVDAHTDDWGDACGHACASFKHSISPLAWRSWFADARWDEAARQLLIPSKWACEQVATRYGDALLASFGEPFAIRHMPVRSVA